MKLFHKQIIVLKKTQKQVNNLNGKLISLTSVLHKKSSAATKKSTYQDAPSADFNFMHEEVWTLKKEALKAEIIATLKFASQNMPFSAAESLAMCYQLQFQDSVTTNSVAIGPDKMYFWAAYGLRPYLTDMKIREHMEGQSYFTLHFSETVNA